MSIDLEGDLSVVDGTESVTYLQITPAGQNSLDVSTALRRALSQSEAALAPPGIALASDDLVWHIPTAALADVVPQNGDQVLAGGETWVVLASQKSTLGSRWRLYCRQAR